MSSVPHAAVSVLAIGCWLAVAGGTFAAEPAPADADGITVHLNLRYREGGSKQCVLDLAVPKQRAEKPRPAILVIHGGGWLEGDKSSFASDQHGTPANIVEFARLGFVAATINYRLSGEAPFPAALDDCRCAVRWLRAHAREYHVDPSRIGAYGNSAGGHLALLLALTDRPTDAGDGEPLAKESSRVQAAASDSGPLDLLYQHEHNQLRVVVEKFMGGPPDDARREQYRRASPTMYFAEKLPPLLLIHGAVDEQVDVRTADEFVAAISRNGPSDLSYIRLAHVGHCPHSLVRVPYLRQVVTDFFTRALAAATHGE
ncbi:MAG: alpha/beta hydrolase [Planctomycetia bacterium]|nr:alpha/beta hydrolase [Planctomycetia bacterium]